MYLQLEVKSVRSVVFGVCECVVSSSFLKKVFIDCKVFVEVVYAYISIRNKVQRFSILPQSIDLVKRHERTQRNGVEERIFDDGRQDTTGFGHHF
jgi:hypothetical protein